MTDLAKERHRLVESMLQIDAELSSLPKKAPGRAELVRQKQYLLREITKLKGKMRDNHFADRFYLKGENDQYITDHALLRWLERKHTINMHKVRAHMLSEPLKQAITTGQKYWSDGEVVFVIADGMVRTVIAVSQLHQGQDVA